MKNIAAVILAAGKGTRMKSGLVKVLHPAAGKPMIDWVVDAARSAGAAPIVLVVGHQADAVSNNFNNCRDIVSAMQEEQLGTGHAVACAGSALKDFSGTVLILCGDTPLLRPETLTSLIVFHQEQKSAVTVLTALMDNPFGYGRVIRDDNGRIQKIVEQKDATQEEQAVCEINSGIYCMESDFLFKNIGSISSDNAQGEFYLTDLVSMATAQGATCLARLTKDSGEIMGVNDRVQLAEAGRILRERINLEHMLSGVSIIDPVSTYIDHGVTIAQDTTIHPNCRISTGTVIGSNCIIESGTSIKKSIIGAGCHIKPNSMLDNAELRDEVTVGPMAHLRPGTLLHSHVKIGNFVETKKTVMGEGSKASHLSYLGDATIGQEVNIGCGTITCNYDGVNKFQTIINDRAFIGSDVQLIAPVTVGANALVAAGTTVIAEVPADALAIGRVRQRNMLGYRTKNPLEIGQDPVDADKV
jgi:bifunctional UDP-N-acetylglucosamine pyrophosphorylase / glucosamine-1-phosphate N-acetyltransferase